jgi:hypothetical protein
MRESIEIMSPTRASSAAAAPSANALVAVGALGKSHKERNLAFRIIAFAIGARSGIVAGADRPAHLELFSAIVALIFVERHCHHLGL